MCVCVLVCTSVSADVLDVVALAVREVAAVAAGVQFAGEVVPQVLPPVVLADRGVGTQSAAEHPAQAETHSVRGFWGACPWAQKPGPLVQVLLMVLDQWLLR